jgi:protein PhnA
MTLKSTPELHSFLTTYLADRDVDGDEQTTREFVEASPAERVRAVAEQGRRLAAEAQLPLEELGMEANRWFGDEGEARAWLSKILAVLEASSPAEADGVVVKDSNGTVLAEGDSVTVIKDLNVKGGSSDLKRGTLIKKIHLIDDPENIECRVDGSTLVLKTCFLKKA